MRLVSDDVWVLFRNHCWRLVYRSTSTGARARVMTDVWLQVTRRFEQPVSRPLKAALRGLYYER